MNQRSTKFSYLLCGALVLGSSFALAQVSRVQICTDTAAPACQAVRGDRSEGWLPQTRSEVMARNGIVTTVQPLAAQAGLRILQQGGNAIDAAVATAAALNVVYPANTGIGGDLFAIIYVAKEKGLPAQRQRNRAQRSDARPHEFARLQSPSCKLRTRLGHALRRNLDGDCAR